MPGGRWRSAGPRRSPSAGRPPGGDRLGEHVALAPALEHALFELRKRRAGVDRVRIGGAVHRGMGG